MEGRAFSCPAWRGLGHDSLSILLRSSQNAKHSRPRLGLRFFASLRNGLRGLRLSSPLGSLPERKKTEAFASVLASGGPERTRTPYLLSANEALYQVSYGPGKKVGEPHRFAPSTDRIVQKFSRMRKECKWFRIRRCALDE